MFFFGARCAAWPVAVACSESPSQTKKHTTAAAAAGGDEHSPKGTGGCAPTPPALRTTGVAHVGRRGGEARRARRVPQRSPDKGVG